MTHSPTTTELLDPLADLDGEELACLGLRRADDFMDAFSDLRKRSKEQAWERYAALPKPFKPRKPPKLSIRRLIEQAKTAGVTTITLPDGTKLELGKTQQQGNEVDEWIAKHASKTQGH
jgi:hypothetical protein